MTGAAAYAAKARIRSDALAVTQAKIPLTQTIVAAEQRADDKASRAEHEQSRQGWAYDVEVVSEAKVLDVRIDVNRGTVIPVVGDKADHDDAHDKQG